jgi:hypothetical protein
MLVDDFPIFDIWWRCGHTAKLYEDPATWPAEGYVFVLLMTSMGLMAGYGLTAMVQATVPLRVRRELLKLCHCIGGLLWLMPFLLCNPVAFVPMALNTFLWGAEPYDNVFSPQLWRIVRRSWARGEKMDMYWAISSVLVHFWFVIGAAVITLGMARPVWFVIAIPCFMASHVARLFAYEHMDRAASVAEAVGVLGLLGCVISALLWWEEIPSTGWIVVATAERCSHLPSCFRNDASWMRSYDLWEDAVRKYEEGGGGDDEGAAALNGNPHELSVQGPHGQTLDQAAKRGPAHGQLGSVREDVACAQRGGAHVASCLPRGVVAAAHPRAHSTSDGSRATPLAGDAEVHLEHDGAASPAVDDGMQSPDAVGMSMRALLASPTMATGNSGHDLEAGTGSVRARHNP